MTTYFYRHGGQCESPREIEGKMRGEEHHSCQRCGGTGIWAYGSERAGICYACGGVRSKWVKLVPVYTAEKLASLQAAQAKRDAKRQAKAEASHQLFVERREFAREIFNAENPGFDFYLEAIAGSDFGSDLAEKLEDFGSLSAKQVDAVINSAIRNIAEDAAKSPVIEGKIVIEGEVLTTKIQESQFGSTLKMLVADDRGFKVWGSVPKALAGSWDDASCEFAGKVERGNRVTFSATVEASDDDETFGFYKRPTKAAFIINSEAA